MLQYKLRQCTNSTIESSYQKWYAQAIITEALDIDSLAEHMAAHNTPFPKGAIKGIPTDMVTCIKEEITAGKAVKIDDLAIFKLGIVSKKGCDDKSSYKANEYIEGVRLRALATGELSTQHRRLNEVGAHCRPFNRCSIGICYEGGRGADGRPADTRTTEQRDTMFLVF